MPVNEQRTIALHNYDEHYRPWGIATIPWSEVSPALAERVTINSIHRTDEPGGAVYAQVDSIDPDDSTLDVLTVYVDDWVKKGGVETGLEVWRGTLDFAVDDRRPTAAETADRLRRRQESERTTQDFWLHNDLRSGGSSVPSSVRQYPRTVAKLVFPAGPNSWEGGAITSVMLDHFEILDAPAAEKGHPHDSEKRLQLDRVTIANPPWATTPCSERLLYKEPWTYVTSGSGAVRMFVTLRSPQFSYSYVDRAGKTFEYACHLYRVVSLFRHANYLIEDLYVKGSVDNGAPVRLTFAPHYFLKMHLHRSRVITRVPTIPDWFSVGTHDAPHPAYGFASTAPVRRLDNPPHDYPTKDQEHAAFGWQLDYGHSIRCLHLFRNWALPYEISDDTGRTWFRVIFKPFRAVVI